MFQYWPLVLSYKHICFHPYTQNKKSLMPICMLYTWWNFQHGTIVYFKYEPWNGIIYFENPFKTMPKTFLACCIGDAKHSMLFTRQKHILQSLGEDTIKWINGTQNSSFPRTHVRCVGYIYIYISYYHVYYTFIFFTT